MGDGCGSKFGDRGRRVFVVISLEEGGGLGKKVRESRVV